jgi:hypothetical protein
MDGVPGLNEDGKVRAAFSGKLLEKMENEAAA